MLALKYARRNIRRTPYQALAASMVMFLTFLVLSVFVILAYSSQTVLQYYESKPQAIAFFKDNTSNDDVEAIKNALVSTGKVKSLKYVSKEEALSIYKERNKANPTLLELVTANILPSSLEISAINPKDLEPIAGVLKLEPVVDEVVYPKDVIDTLSRGTTVIRYVGGAAVGFLIVFATLIILMVIGFKIRIRRTEIEIMKLLGATNWFIRAPFLIEGIFYGVVGAFFAWVASYVLIWYFSPFLETSLGEIRLFPVSPVLMLSLLGIELLVAFLIGLIASYGAVKRHLKI